jgi:hypothetical protein
MSKIKKGQFEIKVILSYLSYNSYQLKIPK